MIHTEAGASFRRKWWLPLLLFSCLGLGPANPNQSFSLDASPAAIFQDEYQQQELHVVVHVPVTGHTICTGWVYPVAQLHEDEWPQRRSCRTAEFPTVEEWWGGKRFPFPYSGEYKAFVESFHDGTRQYIEHGFRVIDNSTNQ